MEAWVSLPLPILKADYFRYLLLLARGGIYADIDTEALKPAHLWLPETSPSNSVGLIVGIEADPTREDWNMWYARRIQFCQWTFRAKAGHPVLREVVARITAVTLKRKEEGRLQGDGMQSLTIIEWTGPAVWTDAIFWGMNSETKTGRGTKAGGNVEEWSWVQFTGITEPKVPGLPWEKADDSKLVISLFYRLLGFLLGLDIWGVRNLMIRMLWFYITLVQPLGVG
jgi:alpha 1,6-mannosyltransferase